MNTFQDEVTNKKTGLTETVLVEWNYNPINSEINFSIKSGKNNITRYVSQDELERIERKIFAISSKLTVEQRVNLIKCLYLQK